MNHFYNGTPREKHKYYEASFAISGYSSWNAISTVSNPRPLVAIRNWALFVSLFFDFPVPMLRRYRLYMKRSTPQKSREHREEYPW